MQWLVGSHFSPWLKYFLAIAFSSDNLTRRPKCNLLVTTLLSVKIQCNTCHQVASLASKLYKIQFRPGLRPGPRLRSLRRSSKSSPHSLSPSTPSASRWRVATSSASNPRRLRRLDSNQHWEFLATPRRRGLRWLLTKKSRRQEDQK